MVPAETGAELKRRLRAKSGTGVPPVDSDMHGKQTGETPVPQVAEGGMKLAVYAIPW